MVKTQPVEIPIEEAQRIVAPYELSEVLQELKENGFITDFLLGDHLVTIRIKNRTQIELAIFTRETETLGREADTFIPDISKQRKRH